MQPVNKRTIQPINFLKFHTYLTHSAHCKALDIRCEVDNTEQALAIGIESVPRRYVIRIWTEHDLALLEKGIENKATTVSH